MLLSGQNHGYWAQLERICAAECAALFCRCVDLWLTFWLGICTRLSLGSRLRCFSERERPFSPLRGRPRSEQI